MKRFAGPLLLVLCCIMLVACQNSNNDIIEQPTSGDISESIDEGFTESNFPVPEAASFSWLELSKNHDRYLEVMSLLGQEFCNGVYSDAISTALSDENERALVEALFLHYQENGSLPSDFTSAFTTFCVGDEFEDMFIKAEEHPFYAALSNSFQISWKSDDTYYIDIKESSQVQNAHSPDSIVEDSSPLVFSCGNEIYTVGNCQFMISEIQVANQIHKGSSYCVIFRIYGTVKNISNERAIFMTTKGKSNVIGTYHGTDGDKTIGGNSNIKWDSDQSGNLFSKEYVLDPGEEKAIQTQALYIGEGATYRYELNMDLYFTNGDEILTLQFG